MAFSDKKAATPQNLATAPQRAGVYKLYDGQTLIYIGRASGGNSTIRTRLNAHHAGREGPCTRGFGYYSYDVTTADVTEERRLLREYKTRHGRLPRCNDRMP